MNWKQPKVYAVKHKSEEIRAASRSGGIFTALSDQVLADGGVIYGCILSDDFDAVHVRAEDEEGFEYPQINDDKCIRCYQCIKVCPIKATREMH